MTLFRDRNLTMAILISALWHFVVIFSIKPVFPEIHIIKHNTSMAFLGDILGSVGNYAAGDAPVYRPSDQLKFAKQILAGNKIDKQEPGEQGFINIQTDKKEFLSSPVNDSSLELNISRKKESARVDFTDFFIKGDARDRVIMHRPDLNEVMAMPSDFNSDFSANIKFRISKEGFVKYAECITSSGFSEIDQAAIRYIRKWQFVPGQQDNQEGIIRVSFK